MNHLRINQDQVHKLKQNGQRNKIVKKYHYNYPVQMIKIARKNPKYMKIKIPETTRDDKIFSGMSASHEEGRIPKE